MSFGRDEITLSRKTVLALLDLASVVEDKTESEQQAELEALRQINA